MENATEALRMAGEAILSLLIITLLIYVITSAKTLGNTKAEQEEVEQRTEFNTKFLAFNKSSMYGTDLISVLGLAISNNKTVNAAKSSNPDGTYSASVDGGINIKFTISSQEISSKTTTTTYIYKSSEGKNVVENTVSKTEVILKEGTHDLTDKEVVEKLSEIAIGGSDTVETTTKVSGIRTIVTEVDNSGFNDLKKLIFKCTGVEYNEVGKIYYMEFEEIDVTN